MSAKDKATLLHLLRDGEEVKRYLLSNEALVEEISHRDRAYAEGKIKLTTIEQLSECLKNRRMRFEVF